MSEVKLPMSEFFKVWHKFNGDGFGTIKDATCINIIRLWKNTIYFDIYDPDKPGKLFYLVECVERNSLMTDKLIITNNGKYAEVYEYGRGTSWNMLQGFVNKETDYEIRPTLNVMTIDDQKIINKAIRKFRRSINHPKS